MDKAVSQLIKDIKCDDHHIRFSACRVFSELKLKWPKIIEALKETTKDKVWFVRLAAIQSLWDLNVSLITIKGTLLRMLKDESEDIREYIACIIGESGSDGEPMVPALINSMDDESGYVRESIAMALGKIGCGSTSTIQVLEKSLEDQDLGVRITSIKALENFLPTPGRDKVIGILKEVLEDKNQSSEIRELAEQILYRFRNS
ncbi:MAG: HEAT repeat domain-containing protein [Thermodesulfobacteriota bacterium]|nr:HEAT repeat domain-containing protein [Thermodesulfobacteriota bacterium]